MIQTQRRAPERLGVDDRLGVPGQPVGIIRRHRARTVGHGGVLQPELVGVRPVLIVDHHGVPLGVHVNAVDAPAEREAGIGGAQVVEAILQVGRMERLECSGLVAQHSLHLGQDPIELKALARREGHQWRRARRPAPRMLGADFLENLVETTEARIQVARRHARHALVYQRLMKTVEHVVDEVALFHVAKARI